MESVMGTGMVVSQILYAMVSALKGPNTTILLLSSGLYDSA
jgi:hypothetical protein